MSSPCRELALVAAACMTLVLPGCEREARRFVRSGPAQQESGGNVPVDFERSFQGNAFELSEGKRLYTSFNCNGCHANGGGAMGPPLMDEKWIYGAEPAQIHETIIQGRPNGMPAFGGRIPDRQIWQLVAYVRSLPGLAPKDAAPGRADHMQMKEPEQSQPERTPQNAGQPPASTE
jgi:cytochrome c oxidase cbb3-type subunit 3